MTFPNTMARAAQLVSNNSPAILTAVAVSGTVATAVLTGKATARYIRILGEEGYFDRDYQFDRSAKEHVEKAWKNYIPPAICLTLTISSIVCANQVGTRRAAALAAAYGVSEKAFAEYKDKVVEKFGEGKERGVRDEVAQDRVTANPPPADVFIANDEMKVLCYESYTGRYFMSSVEDLKAAQNAVNYDINNNYYASLSDFFDRIGLERTKLSDEVGWNSDELLEISFSSTITEHNKPCLVLDFKVVPIRGYSRVH
jgi:uncharacterized protein DUF6353